MTGERLTQENNPQKGNTDTADRVERWLKDIRTPPAPDSEHKDAGNFDLDEESDRLITDYKSTLFDLQEYDEAIIETYKKRIIREKVKDTSIRFNKGKYRYCALYEEDKSTGEKHLYLRRRAGKDAVLDETMEEQREQEDADYWEEELRIRMVPKQIQNEFHKPTIQFRSPTVFRLGQYSAPNQKPTRLTVINEPRAFEGAQQLLDSLHSPNLPIDNSK